MQKIVATLLAACALFGVCAADIALNVPKEGDLSVQTVDPNGQDIVAVTFDVPAADIQQLWMPKDKKPFLERKWWISAKSSSMHNMPYIAFFNLAEINRFSFGAEALEWDCELSSKINQEKGVYTVRLVVVADSSCKLRPFKVTLDRRGVKWTEALKDWRESLSYEKWRSLDAAWKPAFCSWYAVHADFNQDWVERTAAIAAKMGFGTFILDDGWSYDEAKRVNPKDIVEWYRDTGRWDAFSVRKFPDFKAHRERMRQLGMKYIVWVAPHFVGTRSEAFRKWHKVLSDQKPFEGNVLADVTNKAMMDEITGQLVRLMKEADLDGLKVDFLDYIAPSVTKPRSCYNLKFVRNLMSELKSIKPDGVFEFRQSYATPLTVSLGTQFRAGDVPFEWLCNIMSIAQIRLTIGDRIPIHADPIYWSKYENRDNISRHFMAAMAGVPMLSMDLESMPEDQRQEVEKWLKLYSERIESFQRFGKWDVSYRNGTLSSVTSVCGNDALVIVVEPGASTAALNDALSGKKAIVFNLAYDPVKICGVTVEPAKAYVP